MNNVSKTICWAKYTWNPVTGCKRGCFYCYAAKMHRRFCSTPFSNIVFHKKRLGEPEKVKKPSTIFVGSNTDIFYWKPQWKTQIFDVCELIPQHTFMFLTKEPSAYKGFYHGKNIMQGMTLTCEQPTVELQEYLIYAIECVPRPFISIEPILGTLKAGINNCEIVIVGAMTGQKPIIPEKEWIESVIQHVPKDRIYWKNNIKPYLLKYNIGE